MIINKKTKLSDEEYSVIQRHPMMGAEILRNITEFPQLTVGARWRQERLILNIKYFYCGEMLLDHMGDCMIHGRK